MKWGVLVAAITVLLSVAVDAARSAIGGEAVIIADKYDSARKEKGLWVILGTHDEGNYLRAAFRFFIPRKFSEAPIPKGRCSVSVNNQLVQHMDEITTYGEYGRELWFPSLRIRDRIIFTIVWENGDPHVEYIFLPIENNNGSYTELWKSARAEKFFTKERQGEREDHFHEFSLDDVCHFYKDKDRS